MPLTVSTTLRKVFKFAKYGFFICKMESVTRVFKHYSKIIYGKHAWRHMHQVRVPQPYPFHLFPTCVLQIARQDLFPYKKLYDSILFFYSN